MGAIGGEILVGEHDVESAPDEAREDEVIDAPEEPSNNESIAYPRDAQLE